MAEILYGDRYAREKQEKEEKDNLLKEIGKYLTTPELMYSSIEELRQKKAELLAKGIIGDIENVIVPGAIQGRIEKFDRPGLLDDVEDRKIQKVSLNDTSTGGASPITMLPEAIDTGRIYYQNFKDMHEAPKSETKDKYFHSKANVQSVQSGNLIMPHVYNVGKEIYDLAVKNVYPGNGKPKMDNVKDSLNDLKADYYGYMQGLLHPRTDSRKLLNKYRPNNLDKRY